MRIFCFIFMLALASSVYAQLGGSRGAKDDGFNEGSAEGGSGMLGGLMGGGKGIVKAQDIDLASGSSLSRAEIMAVTNKHFNGLKSINITSSTTRYPDFDNAIKDQVSKWKWNAKSGNTTATVPFEFAE